MSTHLERMIQRGRNADLKKFQAALPPGGPFFGLNLPDFIANVRFNVQQFLDSLQCRPKAGLRIQLALALKQAQENASGLYSIVSQVLGQTIVRNFGQGFQFLPGTDSHRVMQQAINKWMKEVNSKAGKWSDGFRREVERLARENPDQLPDPCWGGHATDELNRILEKLNEDIRNFPAEIGQEIGRTIRDVIPLVEEERTPAGPSSLNIVTEPLLNALSGALAGVLLLAVLNAIPPLGAAVAAGVTLARQEELREALKAFFKVRLEGQPKEVLQQEPDEIIRSIGLDQETLVTGLASSLQAGNLNQALAQLDGLA